MSIVVILFEVGAYRNGTYQTLCFDTSRMDYVTPTLRRPSVNKGMRAEGFTIY